jgi:hypothetical protein
LGEEEATPGPEAGLGLGVRVLAVVFSSAYWALQSRFGRYPRLARRFIRRHGLVVSGGPFAGLRYPRRAAVGRIVAKLIGSYEEELHGALEEVLRESPRTVVNIGSAEGYYAVGLARALPGARVHAFEADAGRRALCGELARANAVEDRVVLHGTCTAADLARLGEAADLVVCDCEGGETEVLRPDLVPWLREARLLVELHEAFVPGTRDTLAARFAPTHTVLLVPEASRDPTRYPALLYLGGAEVPEALDEHRKDGRGRPLHMEWAVMTPRGR